MGLTSICLEAYRSSNFVATPMINPVSKQKTIKWTGSIIELVLSLKVIIAPKKNAAAHPKPSPSLAPLQRRVRNLLAFAAARAPDCNTGLMAAFESVSGAIDCAASCPYVTTLC